MEILNPRIETYLLNLQIEKDPLHQSLTDLAAKKKFKTGNRSIPFPIVGPMVGRILYQLALISGAKKVLELGSGFGYSAYWFAKALGPGGKLILTDGSRENLEQARHFLKRMGRAPRCSFLEGDALRSLDKINGTFDIVFIDLNKRQYPQALKKALPRIKKGGLLIADNTLWSGDVILKTADPSTRGIQKFNRMIFSNRSLVSSILPIRDGVAVCVKV